MIGSRGHSDGQITIASRWSRSQPAGRVPVGKSDGEENPMGEGRHAEQEGENRLPAAKQDGRDKADHQDEAADYHGPC